MTLVISIHAPRTGSDVFTAHTREGYIISIHAPRTGSDAEPPARAASRQQFQSTLPARGATAEPPAAARAASNFNPRSPHGERRYRDATRTDERHFNPRSPCGERHGR